jgi:hypothetical protein
MVEYPCMHTEHHTSTSLTVPTHVGLDVLPAQRAASTSHATSPPLTSPHARPMVSAIPRCVSKNPTHPLHHSVPRTAGMLRVTDAPAPCV